MMPLELSDREKVTATARLAEKRNPLKRALKTRAICVAQGRTTWKTFFPPPSEFAVWPLDLVAR